MYYNWRKGNSLWYQPHRVVANPPWYIICWNKTSPWVFPSRLPHASHEGKSKTESIIISWPLKTLKKKFRKRLLSNTRKFIRINFMERFVLRLKTNCLLANTLFLMWMWLEDWTSNPNTLSKLYRFLSKHAVWQFWSGWLDNWLSTTDIVATTATAAA